jgi:predicted dinucleotide-binding enzyme
MQIAVLGAGNVGQALTRAAVSAGHSVTITAAHAERAAAAAEATGATPGTNTEAVRGVDLVVLAVPGAAVPLVAANIEEAVGNGVVVDATNPLNATGTDLSVVAGSGAQDLQSRLPRATVVKAFNTVLAARYATPVEKGEPLDVYIAAEDNDAKSTVAEFAASLGFRPLDVGGIRLARSLEELALLNITLNAANGWVWQTAWRLVGPTSGQPVMPQKAPFNVNMFYKYPMNRVVAIFQDEAQVEVAVRHLQRIGIDLATINVLSGPDGARLLDRSGAANGLGARLLRVMQLGGAFEGETLKVHAKALERGAAVVYVPVSGDDEEQRVATVLRQSGGTHLVRYHRWTIDPLPALPPDVAR